VGIARDPINSDIYILRDNDILKVQSSNGIISIWAGPAANNPSTVSLSFTTMGIYSDTSRMGAAIDFDSQGNASRRPATIASLGDLKLSSGDTLSESVLLPEGPRVFCSNAPPFSRKGRSTRSLQTLLRRQREA
jgi:hypothetical protein